MNNFEEVLDCLNGGNRRVHGAEITGFEGQIPGKDSCFQSKPERSFESRPGWV